MPVYSNGDQWLPGGAICDQCDQKRPVIGVFSVVFGQFFFSLKSNQNLAMGIMGNKTMCFYTFRDVDMKILPKNDQLCW